MTLISTFVYTVTTHRLPSLFIAFVSRFNSLCSLHPLHLISDRTSMYKLIKNNLLSKTYNKQLFSAAFVRSISKLVSLPGSNGHWRYRLIKGPRDRLHAEGCALVWDETLTSHQQTHAAAVVYPSIQPGTNNVWTIETGHQQYTVLMLLVIQYVTLFIGNNVCLLPPSCH